ncbi:MAG TPA: VWA domain-containing protein [Terriglobia bacterium]|nr:VWA domain-containing protein [Terriglobia bacterium]
MLKIPAAVSRPKVVTRGLLLILSCSVALIALRAAAQESQKPTGPTLKVTTEVVNVYAVVEDKHHQLIADLNKDDFELTEDNQPQQITYFSRETDTPLTMGLMIDTSPSQERVLPVEQEQAKVFLDQVLRPKDLIFVLHFDIEVELLQDFTADRQRLARAIDETTINGGGGRPTPGTFPTSGNFGATHLYDAVYLASTDLLKNEVGRKVLILLTDGEDQGSKEKLSTALEVAQKSNIIMYSIEISDRMFYYRRGMGYGGDSVLHKLSEETGGRVIRASNPRDTGAAFRQIADELRTQYLIGYTPTNARHDGTYRKIRLRVLRGEYKVQARRGYYAPTD